VTRASSLAKKSATAGKSTARPVASKAAAKPTTGSARSATGSTKSATGSAKSTTGPARSATGSVATATGPAKATATSKSAKSTVKDQNSAGVPSGTPAASAGPDPGGSPTTDHAPPIAAADAAKGATMGKQADTRTTPTKQASAGESKATKVAPKTSRSAAETEKIRLALAARRDELKEEYEATISEITELQRDRLTDSAGDDQADTGTKTFEREQEISLANSILERVTQVERALERLDEGGYGWCERCGNPIPVERLAAFPSATLCVTCKQLEERR
jgi:RNA polymerase-binding protein DksA